MITTFVLALCLAACDTPHPALFGGGAPTTLEACTAALAALAGDGSTYLCVPVVKRAVKVAPE